MAKKKYRIKDIAQMAGVSVGTVDRVIHNRGEVSADKAEKIKTILGQINYDPGMFISLSRMQRKLSVVMILPAFTPDTYWEQVEVGIRRALYEFSKMKTETTFLYYDQFNLFSCREVYDKALELKCDGMLIAPTFGDETLRFTSRLHERDVPFVFVDSYIDNASPVAYFGPNCTAVGEIQAKLLLSILKPGRDAAIFQTKRTGNQSSLQTITKKQGFLNYIREHRPKLKVKYGNYDSLDIEECYREFDSFFEANKNIGGAVFFNSRAYLLANYLSDREIDDVCIVGSGAIGENIANLRRDKIAYLLAERPEQQGYLGTRRLFEFLLFGRRDEVVNYTPVDIFVKESIDFHIFEQTKLMKSATNLMDENK